jgi:DNA-binding MarR family transcriptional regulator
VKDKSSIPPKLRWITTHILRRAGEKAQAVAKKHMKSAIGLTAREWGILHLTHDQPQSQRVIAQALEITPHVMVILTDGLERRGYLKRTPNPDDRRQHLLKVTPRGMDRSTAPDSRPSTA